jgi:hypothetical protein
MIKCKPSPANGMIFPVSEKSIAVFVLKAQSF